MKLNPTRMKINIARLKLNPSRMKLMIARLSGR